MYLRARILQVARVALAGFLTQVSPVEDWPATKAVTVDGAVWLLTGNGGLFRWTDSTAQAEPFDGPIIDMARTDAGTLLVLRTADKKGRDVLLERLSDGRWRKFASVRTTGFDRLAGLAVRLDYAAVVTEGAVLLARRGDSATRILHRPIKVGPSLRLSAVLTADSSLLIGQLRTALPHERDYPPSQDGVLRIDLRSGKAAYVGRAPGLDPCRGGAIGCSDAMQFINDPTNARCAIATIGSASFILGTYRIARICGDSVDILLDAPCKDTEEAVHYYCASGQIAADIDGFWIIGGKGLIRFRGTQKAAEVPWPRVSRYGRLYSYDEPDIAVIRGMVTAPAWINGDDALLVVRR